MRAFENCLVCGASTENTHSARRGADALVCGSQCYRQASRNFKRNMSGYKVARLIDLLAQMGEPVTAAELLGRYRETYGRSGQLTIGNSVALTSQLVPIVNPETIRVDKSKKPFTFEYVGGTTIGEWLKPSMRAKYESVSFRSEASYKNLGEYAPTERIIQRLKDSGVWELGNTYEDDGLQYIWWATVKIEDGTLVPASLPDDFLAEDLIKLVLLIDDRRDHPKLGRLAVSYDLDEWEDEDLTQLGKELTIIFENNGMFQSDDFLEYGGMGDYFDVHWGDLVNHSCADNAKFDIYEEDEGQGLITMECMECGRTATFRQETPYEGPRNAETFGAESDSYEWEWDMIEYAPTELIKKRLKDAGFSMTSVGTTYKDQIVEFYEPQLIAPNGVVLEVCLSQNEEFKGFSRLTFFEDDHSGDVGKVPDIDWNNWHWNGLLKGEDWVESPQGDYYQVYWEGLYDEWKHGHNCADNAKFDIYEDNLIVMECVECGRTATFEQKTPYEGPRNAETFDAEDELDVSVGDRVRSYDFVLPDGTLIRDDCYMEGRVTKIAPVDWCGAECDHYYILVDKIVRNGEELSERLPGVDMVYPPVSESYLEIISKPRSGNMEEMDAETDEYKGPFEVEIRRPNGSKASWRKYENYRQLIDALEAIVSNRYTPYAIDVFATNVPYISGFTAMGPVTDYRKFHLATWKYGNWESGPWAEYLPSGAE
jgi:Zn ribbon nucleic-acid-binding protein